MADGADLIVADREVPELELVVLVHNRVAGLVCLEPLALDGVI
ncbi:MAG: hypothetical protein ACI8QS_000819 [Planctomycetota bacterium]